MFDFIFVETDEQYAAASILFREYAQWLGIDLSFQSFEKELLDLKQMYASPKGMILLCKSDEGYVGCVAVRPNEALVAELKRMYVKPAFQKQRVGQELLERALLFCKQVGYERVRLDTLNTMKPAMRLYEKNGFVTIPAYYQNPFSQAVYFEKSLV
jgi:carbonic anhydrase